MDGLVWRKCFGGVLVFLLAVSVVWAAVQWSESNRGESSGVEESSLKLSYQILQGRPESMGGHWLRTLNPRMRDVQGDLIWNAEEQQGVMRFIKLPDPKKGEHYRLWIHDSRSVDGKPVSGAVLNSGSGKQELFVAITAQAHVSEPFKFVLTMEPKEGVPSAEQIMLMVQP